MTSTPNGSNNQVWTVGQLRAALAQFPEDLPVVVDVPVDDNTYESFGVTSSPGYSKVNWGDGHLVDDERYVAIDAFAYCRAYRNSLTFESAGD